LQTLSWLFSGVVEHHDSTGVNALVKPGTATLMTAGRGVQHSEVSTPETTMLHGVQLWVVLPEGARHQAPHCDSEPAHPHQVGASTVSVFVGSLPGFPGSLLPTYNEMSGAEIVIPAGQTLTLDVEQGHEYGVLVDTGTITIDGVAVSKHQLAYLEPGHSSLALSAGSSESVRAVVIGGAPFPENIVMWWNFIGRTHEEIEVFRSEWQDGLETGSERFGHLAHLPALPAPEMPSVRLKPRGQSTTSQS
jgi:redox-sensitive bicupin YhaK (pirin superfamily)